MRGREVQGVSDFFRDDDVFVAAGDEGLTAGDVGALLGELYGDNPAQAKTLLKVRA